MSSLVDKVKLLDKKEQQQSLSWADRFERLGVKKELSTVRKSIDIFWRQRAKQQWIEDGDRNTKFFHQVANRRRKFNAIHKIQVDGDFYVDAAATKMRLSTSMRICIMKINCQGFFLMESLLPLLGMTMLAIL